ncbi:2-hydroxyacid dehydrogenase [Catellatospora sichuanensis]|uniref:2-hydroxyacid dehydrogenase n=1 Tax=Catellatospora sichuanensis TaxID=1969805 RepID=UPI00118431C1|nr:2-hydroxyacid dehydrogenase [Catellatospora sichuanensis]
MRMWIAHEAGRELMGPLPGGVDIAVLPAVDAPLPGDPAEVEFWVPPNVNSPDLVALARPMTGLKVIQLLSAGADAWIGRLRDGVTLCDARGVHDPNVAEWVVGAIISSLRRFDHFARAQAAHRFADGEVTPTDELCGKRVLIVGAGSIGAAAAARLTPFGVQVTNVAHTARDGVHGVADLPRLLPDADVVVLLVPLTEQTEGMVDAAFLAAMPDGALLVNAARGRVADAAALTAELASGRLRAALDVTDPEPLPPDSPLWDMPNVLLTPHIAGAVRGTVPRAYRLVGTQVRRHIAGEPLDNQVRGGY